MNAADTAAALAARAEAVCRKYLPQGCRQGRYWCAGDVRGAPGRSLFVRISPPGTPGKWTDAATSQHGDLLDLIRLATGARSLREALTEARRFLAQPAAPASSGPGVVGRISRTPIRRIIRSRLRQDWSHCFPFTDHRRPVAATAVG